MISEKKKIIDFILKENKIENQKEKEFFIKIIESFLKNNIMDINEWDLNTYKKYINFGKKIIIKNENKIENLEKATELFLEYIKKKKKIFIITDNDLDGSSANAIAKAVKLFVKRKYKKEDLFEIQFAYGTSHGLSFKQIEDLMGDNAKEDFLIITADNGINNREEIEKIKEKYKNIKIIITDHHKANEEDHVFDIVDYVINPEAIELNKVSEMTKLKINEDKEVKTSISGAHTFAVLLLKLLEKLKIKNALLEEEIKLICLFSDVGDMINYHLDIHNEIRFNFNNFESKMYIFKNTIEMNNQSFFNKIPQRYNKEKMREYFREITTLFNSVRRLNSLLMSINDFKNEDDLEKWFKTNFNLNVEDIVINQHNLKDFIIKTNKKAEAILEYFGESTHEKYNFYSYIKNIVPYVLLSDNSLKEEKDKIYLEEIMDIIRDLNTLKKELRKHIIEKELYTTYKKEYLEIYFSDIGSILREILSIQVFIEAKRNIPYLNLAINKEENEIKGSFRTPHFFNLKRLLLTDEKILKIKEDLNLEYKILGHDEAAGISFKKKDSSLIKKEDINNFFEKIYKILEKEYEKTYIEEDKIEINLKELMEVNPDKLQKVINHYLYVGVHPFFKDLQYIVKTEEMKEILNVKNLKMDISKKGNKYFSKKAGNITFLYYGEEEGLKKEELGAQLSLKYDNQIKKWTIQIDLK